MTRSAINHRVQFYGEPLIAVSRLGLALFLLAWAQLTATTAALGKGALMIYAVLAAWLAVTAWFVLRLPRLVALTAHAIDTALFALVAVAADTPADHAFYACFIFIAISAVVRWSWRGALLTSVATLLLLAGAGVYGNLAAVATAAAPASVAVRSAFVLFVAGQVAYLGAREKALRSHLLNAAAWPAVRPTALNAALKQALSRATHELGARRAVLLWHEPNATTLGLAEWSMSALHSWTDERATFDPWVPSELTDFAFVGWNVGSSRARVQCATPDGIHEWRGAPVHPALCKRFAMRRTLSLPLRGRFFSGRLFLMEGEGLTADDLDAGRLVARNMSATLDQVFLARKIQNDTTAAELTRLSRDLHDGVLQTLCGTELQLRRVATTLKSHPSEAERRLRDTQQILLDEQRGLRFYITGLRASPLWLDGDGASMDACLQELTRRARSIWNLEVTSTVQGNGTPLPTPVLRELYQVVQEALTNAARHGGASAVTVTARETGHDLHVSIADNGRGFPFTGQYTHETLASLHLGPLTLRERVANLGGTLAVQSSPMGARLDIHIPLISQVS